MRHDELSKWLERASSQNAESLPSFVEEVINARLDDTFVFHNVLAIIAEATLAAHASNSLEGKAWQMHVLLTYNDGPIGQRHLANLLYPQYANEFAKNTISASDWEFLQSRAAKLLSESHGTSEVRKHWLSIVNGTPPFGFVVE